MTAEINPGGNKGGGSSWNLKSKFTKALMLGVALHFGAPIFGSEDGPFTTFGNTLSSDFNVLNKHILAPVGKFVFDLNQSGYKAALDPETPPLPEIIKEAPSKAWDYVSG